MDTDGFLGNFPSASAGDTPQVSVDLLNVEMGIVFDIVALQSS